MCMFVCVCTSFLISKDVSNSRDVVYVIICHCNSQSRYSQPNFLRFVNTIFHSYILCLFHHGLIKYSCNYQVYFYGSHIWACNLHTLLYHLVWKSQEKVLCRKDGINPWVWSSGEKKIVPSRKDDGCLGSHNSQTGSCFTFKRQQWKINEPRALMNETCWQEDGFME